MHDFALERVEARDLGPFEVVEDLRCVSIQLLVYLRPIMLMVRTPVPCNSRWHFSSNSLSFPSFVSRSFTRHMPSFSSHQHPMTSVLNVMKSFKPKHSHTLVRYWNMSAAGLKNFGQSGLRAKLYVYACEGISQATPGYLFSSQVPPMSAFFS